jgi:hypothetical protein
MRETDIVRDPWCWLSAARGDISFLFLRSSCDDSINNFPLASRHGVPSGEIFAIEEWCPAGWLSKKAEGEKCGDEDEGAHVE